MKANKTPADELPKLILTDSIAGKKIEGVGVDALVFSIS